MADLNDIVAELEKVIGKDEQAVKAALSKAETRIREIIREELGIWEKRQVQVRRYGLPVDTETK